MEKPKTINLSRRQVFFCERMYRITVTCPKKSLPFSCLTRWGHMSIDHYAPGGTSLQNPLLAPGGMILTPPKKSLSFSCLTPWGHMSIDYFYLSFTLII